MHPSDYNCPFHGLFMNFSTQIIACCAYRCSYLRFSYPFRPRAESATFLFATMRKSGFPLLSFVPKSSFGRGKFGNDQNTFMLPTILECRNIYIYISSGFVACCMVVVVECPHGRLSQWHDFTDHFMTLTSNKNNNTNK